MDCFVAVVAMSNECDDSLGEVFCRGGGSMCKYESMFLSCDFNPILFLCYARCDDLYCQVQTYLKECVADALCDVAR